VSFVICVDTRIRRDRTRQEKAMTSSRVQLALNVDDLEAATRYYRNLFGAEPAKTRPGYANFEITDPPLKLVLFENPGAASPLNHLGVEVASPADVAAAAVRFASAGLGHTMTEADRCCHAVQHKVWVDAPNVPLGAWEFYAVLADDPGRTSTDQADTCCITTSTATASCCAAGSEE
jgi:catechol 2,3-dioxygenase-like lactoylglutathione lyase family enzyme